MEETVVLGPFEGVNPAMRLVRLSRFFRDLGFAKHVPQFSWASGSVELDAPRLHLRWSSKDPHFNRFLLPLLNMSHASKAPKISWISRPSPQVLFLGGSSCSKEDYVAFLSLSHEAKREWMRRHGQKLLLVLVSAKIVGIEKALLPHLLVLLEHTKDTTKKPKWFLSHSFFLSSLESLESLEPTFEEKEDEKVEKEMIKTKGFEKKLAKLEARLPPQYRVKARDVIKNLSWFCKEEEN